MFLMINNLVALICFGLKPILVSVRLWIDLNGSRENDNTWKQYHKDNIIEQNSLLL